MSAETESRTASSPFLSRPWKLGVHPALWQGGAEVPSRSNSVTQGSSVTQAFKTQTSHSGRFDEMNFKCRDEH